MEELVYLKNDEAVCSSLQVAEKFGKRHDRVLRAIDNLLESLPKNGETSKMFILSNRKAETDTIQKLVEYAKEHGSGHAEMLYMTYSKLANKMAGVKNRDEATVKQLNDLSLMENIILHEIDLGIMKGKHYKEIYKDCKNRLETVKDLAYLEIA